MRANGSTTISSPTQLRNLQLLRALAALSVVMQHAIHDWWSLAANAPKAAPGRYLLNFEFGVDVFFVISGFIMAHTMAADFGTPGAPKRFLLRRFARIVPLYWLLTTVLILGSIVAPTLLNVPIGDLWHVVDSYLFVPNARVTGEVRPVLALGWTLNFEMFFYVLFAVALTLPVRRGLTWLSIVMVALALSHGIMTKAPAPVVYWTNPLILEFLFGIYIAFVFRSGARVGAVVAALLTAAGLAGFFMPVPNGDEADFILRFVVTGIPAALLVLAAALGPAIGDRRALAWGVAMGNASYSLYLVHPFVVRPLRALWSHVFGTHLPAALYIVFCCAGSILVALALYRFIEKPLMKFVQTLGRGKRAPQHAEGLVPARLRP